MTTALAEQAEHDDPDATIGATIRALASAHRVDTAVLARALGISRNSYYNRVNGDKPWHARDVFHAAAFFGCSVQDIYEGRMHLAGTAPFRSAAPQTNEADSRRATTPQYPAAERHLVVVPSQVSDVPATVASPEAEPISATSRAAAHVIRRRRPNVADQCGTAA